MNYGFCLTRGDGVPARGERWGCFQRERFSVTRQDRGGVSRLPLPVGPSSTGAILPSIQCHGRDPLSAVNVIALTGIPSLLPMHGIRCYRHSLPAPLRGREEAAERPGGGGDPAREVFSDTMKQGQCHHPRKPFPVTRKRQGKGRSAPSPSAPPPAGRYPIDTVPWERSSLCRQRDRPHRNPFPAPRHGIRCYRHSLPAPLRGREEAAERPGGGGVSRG